MSELSLSLLGSFAASLDRQSLLPFRAKSVQALLIYLVCEAERAHQREALMDLLWPGMPLASAQTNMRQTLYRLRQAIPEVQGQEVGTTVPFVVATRRTIQINPEAVYEVDVQQFTDLIERDPERAITLYRGDFLADFYLPDSETFEEWVNGRRAHHQRQVLNALDEVTAVHLQNGRYDAAEKLARQQLTLDNLLESGHRQLMEALARNGRRRAALSHYENLSQLLQDELDIAPSAETQALVQAIRAGELTERREERVERKEVRVESADVEIEPPSPPTFLSPLPTATPRHNLPAQPTPFIGRESELAELDKLMADPQTRLTTIVGPGGMGKTRLALAAAERILKETQFPDGVFFVDLAPLNEARQIPEAVTQALQIQFGGEEQLLQFLRDKAMFFILDNFEHVLAGAQWVNTIVAAAPAVQILVTSRERLGLRGEQLFQIPGLDFPDWITPENAADYTAARLFLGAAQRLRSDFMLTEADLPSLVRICQLVGGMPLALELAAGWVELLSLAEISAEIEQSLDLLATELQDVPERQRSIQAVFATTWEQLEPAEQELLSKLSVFRGGFTREAAAQVANEAGSAAATLKLLGRLVSKSLLQTNPSQGRYQLHELLRQFAAEQLEKADETESTRTRHAHFFVEMVHHLEGEIKGGPRQKEALNAIEADLANIQIAWDWALIQGDLEAIDRSLEALIWFHQFRRSVDFTQLSLRVESLLPQGQENYANPLWRRMALFFHPDLGLNENLKHLEKILAAALHDGNDGEIFLVLYFLAGPKHRAGNVSGALENLQEIQSLLHRLEDTFYEYWHLGYVSWLYFEMGQLEKRLELIKRQFELAQKNGDRLTAADAQGVLGFLAEKDGHYPEAERIYRQVLPIFREFQDRWHVFQYATYLGRLAFLHGDFSQARAWVTEGQTLARQFDLPHKREVLVILSMLLNVQEQYIQAAQLCQDIESFRDPFYLATFHRSQCLAYAQCGLGDFTLARNNLHKAFETAVFLKAPGWQVQLLPAAALIAASEDRLARAAELLTLAWHHPAGITGWLEKFPLITQLQKRLQVELSPVSLEEAQYRGRRLSLKETVEALIEELGEPDEARVASVTSQDSQTTVRHNLPAQATPFIGRSTELATLAEFIADPAVRLVTIVGAGGMGKTRLALATAKQLLGSQQFPDGVFFIDLAPLTEPDQMVLAVADALKFPVQSEGNRTPRQQLLDYLRRKQLLLLFDNHEHLLAGVDLLADMLQAAPVLQLLVTSRERLHIRSEQLFLLGGLEFPDWETPADAERYTAVQLFLQSAHRNQPDFALRDDDDLTHLARICRLVAGMPLALELAAAWVDMLPLAEIAAGLQQGLDFLETDMRDVPERHRSVRAAIDYSWHKLTEQERDIFARLSVFRGGFTREAAQAVAGANLRQLARLVNKSLVQGGGKGDGRYQLHELLRQYGWEKLKGNGQETAVRDQHSHFFCTALQKWQAGLQSNQLRQTADAVEVDYRNVEAAWEHALEHGHWEWLLLAVNGLGTYFDANGRWLEGVKLFQESSKQLQPNQKIIPTTAQAARLLIWFSAWQVNLSINGAEGYFSDNTKYTIQQVLQSAFDLLQPPLLSDVDCRAEEAYLRLQMGRTLKNIDGQWEDGQAHLTVCLQLYRELKDTLGIADSLYEAHFYTLGSKLYETAKTQLQEGVTLLQQVSEPLRLTRLLVGIGNLNTTLGQLERASDLFEQAYSTAQKAGHLSGMFDVCWHISSQAQSLGQFDLVSHKIEEMLALAEQMNSSQRKFTALCHMGSKQLYSGQFLLALDSLQKAKRYEEEMDMPEIFTTSWVYSVAMPQIDLHTGQYEKIQSWHKIFGDVWWVIIQEMWASLVRHDYEETISLAQQVVTKLKLEPQNERRGQAEMGSPLALALYELGHKNEAQRKLVQYLQICLELRAAFVQLMPLIPVIARVLADTNDTQQKERAVELWAMAQALPFVGNSQLFTDLLSQPMAEAAATLPTEVVAAAQARGQELDWWQTAAILLEELREGGWGAEAEERESRGAGEQGRFVKEELVATGGFGEVYRGRDMETGQIVVIKRLRAELVAQQPEALARFEREGELLRQLNHPNIVQMIASEEIKGKPCLIMEYVAGGSLRDLLDKDGRLSVARTLDIALELADALSRAHHLGIIHRDLKPGNVLLAEDGTPRLTDFGIARMTQQEAATGVSRQLTQAGALLGTVGYMSPEACRGEELDGRSDIWSFGVLLYEMLTGERPFSGEQITSTIIAILNNPVPDLRTLRPDVPAALVQLIEQMLVKDKEERMSLGAGTHGRMRQVAAELDRIRAHL